MKFRGTELALINRRQMLALAAALPLLPQDAGPLQGKTVFIVPNFHPASCGWLTNFSRERVYCANSYFDHLDRVRDDPNYAFVLSEVNNMIAMMNFQPGRVAELRERIKEGRVELVNGFFLESTINLSGGEALVRLGVEGLRWQKAVFGVRPRFAWNIDVCGTHDQMAQIAAGLGLEAVIYTRKNPTGSALHWAVSPDGTRLLAISPGHYSELRPLMATKEPLTPEQIAEVEKALALKLKVTPEGSPILVLAGNGDYALAPARKEYPSEFLQQWGEVPHRPKIRFTTLAQYVDAVAPRLKSGQIKIPEMKGGTAYDFDAFWIQNPKVKTWYRRCEHKLQATEMLATAVSLQTKYSYPMETLSRAWVQMFLNMDRNTLWGAAGGMVFEHPTSWDVKDRFEWVERNAGETANAAGAAMAGAGEAIGLYNPLTWRRSDPVVLPVPIEGCQPLAPEQFLWRADLPATSLVTHAMSGEPVPPRQMSLPAVIDTAHYRARLDPATGAIISLTTKPGGYEMLGGPANVIVAEKSEQKRGDAGDFVLPREQRKRVASSSESPVHISVMQGALATVVEAEGTLFGKSCTRRTIFHHGYPRIDFETLLNDIPDKTVVVAEFPLSGPVGEVRRGIPYGFSHGAWETPNPELHGWTKGIVPAVRWSHYSLEKGGAALLDRGLSGRELTDRTPIVFLYNATAKYYGYPNSWLSGDGEHMLEYALVAHEGAWRQARIPHLAWEYNGRLLTMKTKEDPIARKPFLETSDNVIVESMRRAGFQVEIRLAECLGSAGAAELTLNLPHKGAWLTDFNGEQARPLRGGPRYRFPVRPQQIITMRFQTSAAVEECAPILTWDPLVPENKRAALHQYSSDKGHPPRGN